MNKKLLTMVTTGAIALSNMNFAFAEGFMATPDDSEFPMFVDGGFIPGGSGCVPKGEEPIFEKIPNAHIPELEMLMEEFDDEAVEPGDDILDDVISGEEYEEEEIDEEITDEDEPIDEDEDDEYDEDEDDDEIMDEIEKDAEKYDKENEEDTIGGIDDDYYDVGEEEEIKDEDPAENIPDEDDKEDKAESNKEKEEVKKSNNKEVVSNENNSSTNVSNNTAGAISQDKEVEHKVVTNAGDTKVDEDKVVKELDEPQGKGNSSGNPKTGDIGIIGSIAGMIVGLGGIILRKKL